ncbi:MAG: diaminopimelate dehydrogenase [Firmicutes bacterium]|nr:diaminopimelate dehydrogenase [Bacillota bacterium]NLL89012.1 diaminopimelate dehydrogenase [Bacillota bacterium]HKM17546.1 diaminopimelate dehydrogenase [Limnochordia bacterium]
MAIRTAVIGYGNIGKYAVEAVLASPDLELAGVVRRQVEKPAELDRILVVADIRELGDVDVALICTPTRSVPEYAARVLALGINTVDSYDVHGKLADLRRELDRIAQRYNAVAVVSAGWDPGTDSMIRAILSLMAPKGVTYTNFGPGMSMGHSVVVKAINGVKDALSITVPLGSGIHRRVVYVQPDPGADFEYIEQQIKNDPYFVNDQVEIHQVDDVGQLMDAGHGVVIERKGVSGKTANQLFKFEMRINNPALTAQNMVSCARASVKQKPGAYTMLEIPIIDYLYGDPETLLRQLV